MFLYFAPNWTCNTPPDVLRYAFESAPAARQIIGDGPGGQPGMAFCADADRLVYDANNQEWQQIPGTDCWCGVALDGKPDPVQLMREHALKGHYVTLGESGDWLIPVARQVDATSPVFRYVIALPRRVVIGGNGQWQEGPIVAAYQRLWDIGCRWFDAQADGVDGTVELSQGEAFTMASEVVAFNYRVGPVELSLLGAWHSRGYAAVLDALIDAPGVNSYLLARSNQLEKKSG